MHIREEIRFSRPQSRIVRALIVLPGALASLVMIAIVLAWLVGRFTSDRYGWSQWLLWIPTPVALMTCAMNILLSFRATLRPRDSRLRAVLWLIATVGIAVYFALIEHHMFRRAPQVQNAPKSLTVAHWNVGPATWHDIAPSLAAVTRLGADITFVTDPGGIAGLQEFNAWLGSDNPPSIGRLAVYTRLPVTTFRPILASEGLLVALAVIDTTAALGRPLTVYMVDMPSKLKAPRMELARKFRAMLEQANPPPPDLVVGDFNLTRDSASLKMMFPALHHAYHQAGHGYAATFHREFPLWHIDQMLLGSGLRALDYQIKNPGIGRHRAQWAVIAPSR
jgi:hypothetical protein